MTDRQPPREEHVPSPFGWVWTAAFLAISVSSGYATIRWLASPVPLGALTPAPFLVYALWTLIQDRKYGTQSAMVRSNLKQNVVAVMTVVGLITLYSAGRSTGKNVYTHQGTSLAIFGSFFLIIAVLGNLPKSRERKRIAREEYKSATRQSTGEL